MTRTTGFWELRLALRSLLAASTLCAVPARAADEDTQLWFYFNGIVPLGSGASATVELSPRLREGPDQLQTRATLELAVADGVTIGAGGAYVRSGDAHELRPHQQIVLSAGRFSFRTRAEERFFEGASRAQIRLRQRLGASIPLGERTALNGWGELFYIARPERREDEARIEQWRAGATLQQRLSPRLTGTVGYMLILTPREGTADRISHVPQVTLVFRP